MVRMTERGRSVAAVALVLSASLGHAMWALARWPDDGDHTVVAIAAATLELLLFASVAGAILAAARLEGTRARPLALLRALGLAQAPAALYFLGLLPPLTHFVPLLVLVLVLRFATGVLVARVVASLPLGTAFAAVRVGAATGIFAGFAVASLVYA